MSLQSDRRTVVRFRSYATRPQSSDPRWVRSYLVRPAIGFAGLLIPHWSNLMEGAVDARRLRLARPALRPFRAPSARRATQDAARGVSEPGVGIEPA